MRGTTLGVLGGGQLGRMMALAGTPLGLRFRFVEPKDPCPADGLGTVVRTAYDDVEGVRGFARGLEVVTYEFENVPVASARALVEDGVEVHPAPAALEMAQDRLVEKKGFQSLDIPTAPFYAVSSRTELDEAVTQIGLPAVLKTRRFGYDGKGQRVLRRHQDLEAAWEDLGGRPLILERFIDFSRELSQVSVRGRDGTVAHYPLVENLHEDAVLRMTTAPAPLITEEMAETARGYVGRILEHLDYVGVVALELFHEGDHLLANEMAPRVHNSGHWTQNGTWCSQFENHVRAVAGLPLGSTEVRSHTAMFNLLGAVPPVERLLAMDRTHLHLYDKEPRPGRKLGHVNVVGADPGEVRATLEEVEALCREAEAGAYGG